MEELEETILNPENHEVIVECEDEEETQLPLGEDNPLQKSYHELQDKPMSSTLIEKKSLATIEKTIDMRKNSVERSIPLLSVTFDNMLKTAKYENSGINTGSNLSRKYIHHSSAASPFYAHRCASTASTTTS